MKIINLNTGEGLSFTMFPDNQPHVVVRDVEPGEKVKVICAITDSIKMLQLLQVANALDHLGAEKEELFIPYLLGARYDRLMQPGDSFDLEVIAGMINSCRFKKVQLLDVHSPVALTLIKYAENISNRFLVEQYDQANAVLICPDKGAAHKVKDYLAWNSNIREVVYCRKSRDLASGKITLEVLETRQCEGRNCVIIDDICDGGGTFLSIAEQIRPAHLTLVVTHGIFSKGFSTLEERFDEIIVSNSLSRSYSSAKTHLVPLAF